MQAKQRKKKLPWWARLLIVLLIATIVFLGFSYGMIRYFVGDTLSFKGILSMVSYSGFDLPAGFRNFVLDVDRTYPGLPELLVNEAGDAVETPEQYHTRREEMRSLYETYMYGVTPTDGFDTTFTIVESGSALNGKAERQQVRITVSNEHGSSDAMLLIYTPANAENYGMFVGLNFSGNTAVWDDEAILSSSSQDEAKPVWRNIYGLEVIPDGAYEDVIPDQPVFSEGVAVHVHSEGHLLTAEDWQNYIAYMNDFVCSEDA